MSKVWDEWVGREIWVKYAKLFVQTLRSSFREATMAGTTLLDTVNDSLLVQDLVSLFQQSTLLIKFQHTHCTLHTPIVLISLFHSQTQLLTKT